LKCNIELLKILFPLNINSRALKQKNISGQRKIYRQLLVEINSRKLQLSTSSGISTTSGISTISGISPTAEYLYNQRNTGNTQMIAPAEILHTTQLWQLQLRAKKIGNSQEKALLAE
jgi:hypothetical protein